MKKIIYFSYALVSLSISAQCFDKVFAGKYHFIAVSQDGTLWAWGKNDHGYIGDGTTTEKHTPVQISTETGWEHISAGRLHNVAIKSDGTLWAWGNNFDGQTGNGTSNNNVLYPMQIGIDTDWKEASAGDHGSVAVKTDGTLWTWGKNTNGYLGNGMAENYQNLVPTQVGTETDWKSVSGKDRHCLAIKNDGSLWAWGRNFYGQLGIGTSGNGTDVYTPVQVGTATDWKQAESTPEFSYALKENNTLWAWSSTGRLGITTTQPIQVGTHNDWKTVSVFSDGSGSAVLLTKENGTLWAWGSDYLQRLGNGTQQGDYQSPTQIGTETDWVSASIGYYQSNAIKADGTFWAWGATQLVGNGSGNIPSPTQYACTSLSVENIEITNTTLRIYPNPANSVVNFSFPVSGKIIDITGKEILSINESTSVDVSSFSKGMYFIIATDGTTEKLIIQ